MESKFLRLSPAVFFYHLQYSSSHSVFLILGRPQPTLMHLRTFPCLNAVFPYPAYYGQETHLVAPEASCRAFDVLEDTMTWDKRRKPMTWDKRRKPKLRAISSIPLTPEKPGRWFSHKPPFPWSTSPCRLRSFFCKVCCQMGIPCSVGRYILIFSCSNHHFGCIWSPNPSLTAIIKIKILKPYLYFSFWASSRLCHMVSTILLTLSKLASGCCCFIEVWVSWKFYSTKIL